jgi:uncharacterized protein
MQHYLLKKGVFSILLTSCLHLHTAAQEYVSPTAPPLTGKAPGMQVKLLSTTDSVKTYVLVFKKGDEVRSGLTEFAAKYQVKSGHYTAIGDVISAKVGWYDPGRKQFKVIPINEPAEVTSLTGNIALSEGKPVAHSHVNVSISDGTVRGGHLLEMYVGPTLEVYVTVTPAALYKKLDKEFDAAVIDLSRER